ncbi:MAG: NADH:flavin oxidoreductase/NADH oxidase family protein [Chitinophagales bacterium]|nr:NADH:flavin oxidoreductase/NADH oxidase family protein [Chitinophagales bacterium]MCZ2393711.1 NADH:flavin oxidoreductase/NADH oxidase family protein [Chitinophagales bacterium]
MLAKDILAQSFSIKKGVIVKNRILKSAMSEGLGNKQNAPTQELITLYQTWANGGIGINITGNVMVDRRFLGEPGNVVIEDESHLEKLKQWAQAATNNDTQCWVQLNHPGKQSPKRLNEYNVAPSAIPFKPEMQAFFSTPRELTHEEILDIIQRFGRSAGIVKKAGFTGVQIHGAHGYLVSQFLSPHHNIRTDQWGGSPENRRRFVIEVYKAMRQNVGENFPIGIKLNSADFQRGGFTEEESLDTLKALSEHGIDLIEISGGTYEAPAMTGIKIKESTRLREAYFIEFAEKARKIFKNPLVVTGGFQTAEGMAQAISSGAVDFVGVARSMAIEPDLPNKLLNGQKAKYSVKPIKTGISLIDKMAVMEVSWYSGQLRRIGKGNAPQPNESPLLSFFRIVIPQIRIFKRLPSRLRAS